MSKADRVSRTRVGRILWSRRRLAFSLPGEASENGLLSRVHSAALDPIRLLDENLSAWSLTQMLVTGRKNERSHVDVRYLPIRPRDRLWTVER